MREIWKNKVSDFPRAESSALTRAAEVIAEKDEIAASGAKALVRKRALRRG
jgi:hypothetical protein